MQYFVTVFISAFLVFQIQPIASKILLPWFGGGAGVWTTCLLFFQFFLLAGYFYAYLLSRFFNAKKQAFIHLGLLFVSLLTLPIQFSELHLSTESSLPTLDILKLLGFGIGLPFLVLSATSPLLQSWFSRFNKLTNPYLLYAMSNLGSFLALITYPIFIEPTLLLTSQTFFWSACFILFVVVISGICINVIRRSRNIIDEIDNPISLKSIPIISMLLWFLLSALGVVILVSTTNAMTQNVPPMPFLWVAPLALYLGTYVLAFSHWNIYQRKFWVPTYIFAAILGVFIYFIGGQFDILTQVIIYLFILLTACMICHGELNNLKPEKHNPTLFYLILSMGGVFGSFMVSVVAQYSFDDFFEFPIAIASVFVLLGFSLLSHNKVISAQATKLKPKKQSSEYLLPSLCFIGSLCLLLIFLQMNNLYQQYDIVKTRNFYGVLTVKDVVEGNVQERRLVDGTTAHGGQSLEPTKTNIPLSYYRPSTGVELVLTELSNYHDSLNVGIVGLGVGALAAYGKANDEYTFYELNPAVVEFAHEYFSFIRNSNANVSIQLGDARVNLQAELDKGQLNHFDVLVIDAFSGDQIPTHLLTQQAFLLYDQHIDNNGVIVLHISNRHLSLLPVVLGNADLLNMQVMFFSTSGGTNEHDAEWLLLSKNTQVLENPNLIKAQTALSLSKNKRVKWTDDYSSLLPILKVLN
ncbi:fused MFS/spermidine synthase [Paraglaciecola sp. L3A3]|uniref:fused MFS/spermidine synthase n=1 Tax=Paraglaciecola sp. L3A3 TaxID=2686358 RepID=UPI00131E4622|nr:fused MFS/spermidine synthase [Paraglaciecola sp. L3A3]